MFLSLEIDIFNKYVTNLKTTISIPQEPDNLRFAPFIIFNINFAFLKIWLIIWLDIVHIVRIMSPELQPMTVQYLCHLIQKELIWPVCKTLSIISIKNEKNENDYNRSKPEILRLLWDIVIFRLVAYLLNIIC